MLRRLTMIIALVVGMFVGMGFVVPQKAEAGWVIHYITHGTQHGQEHGWTSISYTTKYFRLNTAGNAKVDMGYIGRGWWLAIASMRCGGWDQKRVFVYHGLYPQWFWLYP